MKLLPRISAALEFEKNDMLEEARWKVEGCRLQAFVAQYRALDNLTFHPLMTFQLYHPYNTQILAQEQGHTLTLAMAAVLGLVIFFTLSFCR